MVPQMIISGSSEIAFGADVGFLFVVLCSNVFFQMMQNRATEVALGTRKRLLTSVRSHMSLQRMRLNARVVTLGTLVRLFASVRSHVNQQ